MKFLVYLAWTIAIFNFVVMTIKVWLQLEYQKNKVLQLMDQMEGKRTVYTHDILWWFGVWLFAVVILCSHYF